MPHRENPLINYHREAANAEGKQQALNIEMDPLRQVAFRPSYRYEGVMMSLTILFHRPMPLLRSMHDSRL